MLRWLLLCFAGSFCFAAGSQNAIGLPEIINYTKGQYGAGTQNWEIQQGRNGIMYFANNEGLLSFDGTYWKVHSLPNKTNVRSVRVGADDRIYVGGQDEIGYFSPDQRGSLQFNSLKHLIPAEHRSFADVWDIIREDRGLFFRSGSKIFQFSANTITVYPGTDWRFMGSANGKLIAQDHKNELLLFQNGVWAPFLSKSELPADFLVTSLVSIGNDTTLLTTFKHGIFVLTGTEVQRWNVPAIQPISEAHIYTAIRLGKDRLVIATSLNGCYIIDDRGRLIQSFARTEGLQNNNILSAFEDRNNNLWLGLDNGISFIAHGSAIRHVYPDPGNEGSGYAALIFENRFYAGTSNGLYTLPLYAEKDLSLVKGAFKQVELSKGQVWNLSAVNNLLLMGHHEGSYIIRNNRAELLDGSSGFWTFLPFYNVLPSSLMVAGTYQGVKFYHYINGQFQKAPFAAQFESSRFVAIDNNTIWVAHPYKGVFKITLAERSKVILKNYSQKNGLFSVNNNYVYKIRNRILILTEKGIFEYNSSTDGFERSALFDGLFAQKQVRYMKEDPAGNIWFIWNKNLGVVDMSGDRPQVVYIPELNNKMVSGFEHIYPVDEKNIFMGAEKGFYHINYALYRNKVMEVQSLLRHVTIMGKRDSLIFDGYFSEAGGLQRQPENSFPELAHAWNSLHFEYSSPVFGQQENVEYSYFLKGFDKNWSEWTRKTEKDYTNLPAGKYTFQVRARNNLGNVSAPAMYTFTVLPPWYQTTVAFILYAMLLLAGLLFLYRLQQRRFRSQEAKYEEEQKRLRYLHQLEMEKSEKEIVKLRNEKLEAEIEHKNTELASAAMHLVQKGELLTRIREELVRLKKSSGNDTPEDFRKIIRILSEEDKMDADWEQFALHFDKVHSDFLMALKKNYPTLSANELKLCAYLRMNLSTKEIAQLMNISVRGVEISRYRLRKKLQIPAGNHLFDFLIRQGTSERSRNIQDT